MFKSIIGDNWRNMILCQYKCNAIVGVEDKQYEALSAGKIGGSNKLDKIKQNFT